MAWGVITWSLLDGLLSEPRKINKSYQDKLVVAFLGAVSSGKSSGIKALWGFDSGTIHPIPGTTKDVVVWSTNEGYLVADTPGLQDSNEELVKKTKNFIDNVDIFVYLINSNGGINQKVKDDLEMLTKVNRPLLVVLNKIDTIPDSNETGFFTKQLEDSNILMENFIEAAFNPITGENPVNIDKVKNRINMIIKENGEGLLDKKKNAEKYLFWADMFKVTKNSKLGQN